MNPSWRKPVGMLLILVGIAVWAVLAVMLVERLGIPMPWDGLAYLIAGVAWLWLLPMKRLLRWMELGVWRD